MTEKNKQKERSKALVIGEGRITIDDVVSVSRGRAVALSKGEAFRSRIVRGARYLEERLSLGDTVYGVNTGYGESCHTNVPAELIADLPLHLSRYHGCGLGKYLSPQATRAVMACRLTSLAAGLFRSTNRVIRRN